MASDGEITSLADVPGYKEILKAVLKTQIQGLVEQLAKHTDEESLLLTANVSDGTISHLGSNSGRTFLTSQDDLKSQFLGFCIKMHHQQPFADPNRCAKSDMQPTLDMLKSTISQKILSRRQGSKQRPVPYNVKNRPLLPTSTKSKAPVLSKESGQVPVAVTVSSQDSVTEPVTGPDNSVTLIIKQEPKSDDENSTNSTNFRVVAMETENNSTTHNDTFSNTLSGQSSASWIEPVCNDHLMDSQTRSGQQFTLESPAVPVTDQDRQEIDDLLANTSDSYFLSSMTVGNLENLDRGPKSREKLKTGTKYSEFVKNSCHVCGKVLNNRSNLKRHMRIHTGEKPYSCEICFRKFNQSSSMKNHMIVHMTDLQNDAIEIGIPVPKIEVPEVNVPTPSMNVSVPSMNVMVPSLDEPVLSLDLPVPQVNIL